MLLYLCFSEGEPWGEPLRETGSGVNKLNAKNRIKLIQLTIIKE